MIVCAIHLLHWEICDPQLSKHQDFPLWVLYQHVFWKNPSLFSFSSRCRSLGLSESECRHHAYPSPVPLLLAAPLEVHEKKWQYLDAQATGLSKGLRSSTNFSLNSCSQSGKSCNRSLCTSSRRLFLFVFSVSADLCTGFLHNSSLVLPLLSSNSLWIPVANQATHAIFLSVLLLTPHFYFCFRFLWIHAAGLPEASLLGWQCLDPQAQGFSVAL